MGELVERASEVSAVQDLLTAAASGGGGSLLLTGSAGIGKSALVDLARETARAAGFVVLSSSPTPVSGSLSHGVVRDWLGPHVRSARPAGGRPFDGPAADLAEALKDSGSSHHVWNLASLDYALTWALENLGDAHPLLLVVDDVQWADVGSLQLLDLLSARLPHLPAALLLAARSGEPALAPAILDRLATRATLVDLAPLSVAGVEQLRREMADSSAQTGVTSEELHRLTGGVPFMLHELLRSGARGTTPRGVVDSVRERLDRLGPEAVAVARSVAVLADEASMDAVADLTGLGVADLTGPLDLLAGAGILNLGMWRASCAHPLVAEAVISSMSPAERSEQHRAAASYLRSQERPQQVVASHLVHTLPTEDPAVVELLRAAGEESLRTGAPDVAARQLLRAVQETRPESTDPSLVALAASANLMAGRRAEAFELWDMALERTSDPVERATLLTGMGDVQMTMGERRTASESYHRAVTGLTAAGHDRSSPELRRVLVRVGLTRALWEGVRGDIGSAISDAQLQDPTRDSHTDRLLFALGAADLAVRGCDRPQAVSLARRAMGGGALLAEETSDGIGFYVASGVLSWADAYDDNLEALEAAIQDARRRGSVLGFATASYCRGLARMRQGHLRQAVPDFQSALDLRARGWSDFADTAVAGAAFTHIGLGQHEEALALEPELRAAARRGQFTSAQPLAAAGIVRATHGDHEQALTDYRDAARLMGANPDNASIVEWREVSVWSLLALGRRDEARELAEEALGHARRWGAPRALGFSLRTLAQASERDEAVGLLRESVELLERARSLDYLARSRVDLARLLLPGTPAEREEAVTLLRAVLEHGRSVQVAALVQRSSRLLAQAGVPIGDDAATPLSSLTPGERRVSELAAAGATNRQIAQKLFVTVKAVEWHLSNAYRKLGISSRAQLSLALYGDDGPSSSSDM